MLKALKRQNNTFLLWMKTKNRRRFIYLYASACKLNNSAYLPPKAISSW